MSYQFAHIETYSRKTDKGGRSVNWVLDEADREPGACGHVENPGKPDIVHGCSISELRAMHDQACAEMKYEVAGGGKPRAVRVDQKTLFTVIASHELSPQEIAEDPAKKASYEVWERDTVAWLQDQYGDDLKTVVRHSDEGHMHIHAYVLPSDLRALEFHPGVSAKRAAKAEAEAKGLDGKAANAEGDKAYKTAMRDWQDSYHEKVAQAHGLARLGPGKRRLTREEWQTEKAQAAALQVVTEKARVLHQQGAAYQRQVKSEVADVKAAAAAEVEKVRLETQRLKAEAAQRMEEAKRRHDAAVAAERKAQTMLSRAQKQAQKIMRNAISEAEKVASIGTRFRGFWDSLRKSAIRDDARKEFQDQLKSKDAVIDRLAGERNGALEKTDQLEISLKHKDRLIDGLQSEIEVLKPKPQAVPKLNSQTRRFSKKTDDDDDYHPTGPRM